MTISVEYVGDGKFVAGIRKETSFECFFQSREAEEDTEDLRDFYARVISWVIQKYGAGMAGMVVPSDTVKLMLLLGHPIASQNPKTFVSMKQQEFRDWCEQYAN